MLQLTVIISGIPNLGRNHLLNIPSRSITYGLVRSLFYIVLQMGYRKYLGQKFPAEYLEYHRRWIRDQSVACQWMILAGREIAQILTCFMATMAPVASSSALYTTPKLPPVKRYQ
jgi:hypothetical protein